MYVRVRVEEVMDDIDTVDLAKELVTREKWREALDKAENKQAENVPEIIEYLRDIANDIRDHRPIDDKLSRMIWVHAGVIV